MDRRVDLGLSLGIVLFGVLLLIAAQNIALGTIRDPVGPRGVPTFTALVFIVGGIVLAARRLLTWSSEPGPFVPSDGKVDEPGSAASAVRAFGVMAVSVSYALALPILGFLLATPALLAALMWILEVRSVRLLIGVSVGYTLIVYVTFTQGLSVSLPGGLVSGLVDAFGL